VEVITDIDLTKLSLSFVRVVSDAVITDMGISNQGI
jgi:hypothetical protein